jgi:hypothetical protein
MRALLIVVPVAAVLVLGASPAGSKNRYCAKWIKGEHSLGQHPVAKTRSHGTVFYGDSRSKSTFYACSDHAKASSEGYTVDGATGFTVKQFAAGPSGRCALAVVTMKGHPSFEGQEVSPTMIGEFRLRPHMHSAFEISADEPADIQQLGFSKNCFEAWSEGGSLSIVIVDTNNFKTFTDINHYPTSVRVSTAADLKGWTLKAHGSGVTLHYTDGGVAKTQEIPAS